MVFALLPALLGPLDDQAQIGAFSVILHGPKDRILEVFAESPGIILEPVSEPAQILFTANAEPSNFRVDWFFVCTQKSMFTQIPCPEGPETVQIQRSAIVQMMPSVLGVLYRYDGTVNMESSPEGILIPDKMFIEHEARFMALPVGFYGVPDSVKKFSGLLVITGYGIRNCEDQGPNPVQTMLGGQPFDDFCPLFSLAFGLGIPARRAFGPSTLTGGDPQYRSPILFRETHAASVLTRSTGTLQEQCPGPADEHVIVVYVVLKAFSVSDETQKGVIPTPIGGRQEITGDPKITG
jgi:hypothetical protein